MASRKKKTLDLALQGGGAHGAFAWGVLDYLLEDGRIDFSAITAASAGAMNATAMSYGLVTGGKEKAREVLTAFWRDVSNTQFSLNDFIPMETRALFPMLEEAGEWFNYMMAGSFTQAVSPYQFNPLNINPLKEVLERHVDFAELRKLSNYNLYISATNVRTGKVKVFQCHELTSDMVMASACLPTVYQAVEIDGEAYWDGGFSGNPPLWPLFYDHSSRDVLVVMLNPLQREEVPTTAAEIQNRVNEISFNAALLKEMRAVSFVQKLIHKDMLKDEFKDNYSDILFHNIRADKELKDLSVATKFKMDWPFLENLKERGRTAAKIWLTENYKHIGKKGTVDLRAEFIEAGL